VSLLRIAVDSFPQRIRNSRVLFDIAKSLFGVPEILYTFRSSIHKFNDLSDLYTASSPYLLKRVSHSSDINMKHRALILRLVKEIKPKSILDLGCGNGFLLKCIRDCGYRAQELIGVDIGIDSRRESGIEYIQEDILTYITETRTKSIDMVLSCHTLEHMLMSKKIVEEMLRVSAISTVIICPIEKRHKWGMNYHVHFYETVEAMKNQLGLHNVNTTTIRWLGDAMIYVYHSI